eukprot:jgi/Hompol1/739/HPOL_005398-RA
MLAADEQIAKFNQLCSDLGQRLCIFSQLFAQNESFYAEMDDKVSQWKQQVDQYTKRLDEQRRDLLKRFDGLDTFGLNS